MKLRNKINLYTVVLFAALLLVMNITVYFTFSKLILDSELHTSKKEMEKNAKDIGKSLGTIPEAELLRSYVPINGMIQLVTFDNNAPSTVTSPTEQNLIRRTTKFSQKEESKFISYQKRVYTFESMPIILLDGSVANLQITKSIKSASDNLNVLRLVLILVTLLTLIPVVVSSLILSKLITKPVTSMIKTMKDIRQSGRFKRIALEGKSKDELFHMGETFNHMIDLLETNYEKQKQFVSNASHEFKTPLTIIESYASLLKRRGLSEPELFAESIEAIHSEAVRMKDMTEQLLMLAKHHEQWNVVKAPLKLRAFVQQTVKSFQSAYNREIQFQQDNWTEISVSTDEKKLKQLLFIFLDNARKYSDETISVILGVVHGEAFISVVDTGIGIHHDELSKVFDRFYRVDKARNRKKGGSGLGLSLAKEIADAIDIKMTLESEEGVGTTSTLFFKTKLY
ncbi:HAMP domain-containing histidine kinase [Bacillus sp. sid0103]|uniref:HAMP domain-containing sensor histidine kinase n=1 Tax=Bacillus sp. sid0103 TaxID=2856337 RepID=UPI001C472457|nr:HAMP domain-containing sensor histidine kinase [Bacillus sp. sid0103]MBV7504009.1 HAMP domain-containing histidine kinase [Bacillus sp. sid0103]